MDWLTMSSAPCLSSYHFTAFTLRCQEGLTFVDGSVNYKWSHHNWAEPTLLETLVKDNIFRFLLWDVCTRSSFSFSFPFLSLFQHPSQCQPLLTYTFRGTPEFHILVCPCLPFRTYIALHSTHLFPSFNILFADE